MGGYHRFKRVDKEQRYERERAMRVDLTAETVWPLHRAGMPHDKTNCALCFTESLSS